MDSNLLFLKDEESQGLFILPFRVSTETEPMPNPGAGDSERVACKSKKGKGFREPNTELLPNPQSASD